MNKYISILAFFLISNLSVYGSDSNNILGKIEDSLYGFQYNGDSIEDRLFRVENTVYGYNNSGNIYYRIKKL